MRIVVVFGSVEGQARKVACFSRRILLADGHDVELLDSLGAVAPGELRGAERIILVASVHERRHPPKFEALLTEHRDLLRSRPTLLLSVSLSAACPEAIGDAEDYVVEMSMRTGFTPGASHLVAGALRGGRYDDFARLVLRNGVVKGRSFDIGAGETEFTDWGAIRKVLDGFAGAGGATGMAGATACGQASSP